MKGARGINKYSSSNLIIQNYMYRPFLILVILICIFNKHLDRLAQRGVSLKNCNFRYCRIPVW